MIYSTSLKQVEMVSDNPFSSDNDQHYTSKTDLLFWKQGYIEVWKGITEDFEFLFEHTWIDKGKELKFP